MSVCADGEREAWMVPYYTLTTLTFLLSHNLGGRSYPFTPTNTLHNPSTSALPPTVALFSNVCASSFSPIMCGSTFSRLPRALLAACWNLYVISPLGRV